MAKQSTRLAKLTKPRVFDALYRDRLFHILDSNSRYPVVWIVAPPGSGKTTLISTYLEAKRRAGIWYQVDAGDTDPATFFYYLGLAERRGGAKKLPALPLLTQEFQTGVDAFGRRFFRELFARMDSGATIVFDNFQELPPGGTVSAALAAAIEEVPEHIQVFVISRNEPPQPYTRLIANRIIKLLDWEDIRLTPDESQGVLRLLAPNVDRKASVQLTDYCGGWAAGLVLVAAKLRNGATINSMENPESIENVFSYFTKQVFEKLDEEDRFVLARLSFLPSVSESMAVPLGGRSNALEILERLYRQHMFTDRRSNGGSNYHFHALFHTFLQREAQEILSKSERFSTQKCAAGLLEASGHIEAARALYTAINDTVAVAKIIRLHAGALIAQGRWNLVVDWIEVLPQEFISNDCWLTYWLGTAQIGTNPHRARRALERASAQSKGDIHCQIMSAVGIVETYLLEYTVFEPLGRWIPTMEQVFELPKDSISEDSELRIHSALLMALTYRQPEHPSISQCASRLEELIEGRADVNFRVSAAANLALHGCFTGEFGTCRRAIAVLEPLLSDATVTSLRRAFSWAVITFYSASVSDNAQGTKAVAANIAIARDQGLHEAERFACTLGYLLEMDQHRVESGRQLIERFEQIAIQSKPYEAASLVNLKSWHGVFTGDAALALQYAPQAVAIYEKMGSIPQLLFGINGLIWVLVEANDAKSARHWIKVHKKLSDSKRMHWSRCVPDAAEALLARENGEIGILDKCLTRIFAQERGLLDKYGHTLAWCRTWAPKIAALALERDIEVDRAHRFIRDFGLSPPNPHFELWPWHVKIRCLGRFSIELDGKPLTVRGKAPIKLLALLKVIVALGGENVPVNDVEDALWSDEDGDTARQSLTIALHRLRKLLGNNQFILQHAGRLSLDLRCIWVDALAFGNLALQLSTSSVRVQGEQLIGLYGGSFLTGDENVPWAMSMRTDLRAKYVDAVCAIGRELEREGELDGAIQLYRQGLAAEKLTETFYQGLMRCYVAIGRMQDVIEAYNNLRDLLASRGAKPSAATEALFRRINTA